MSYSESFPTQRPIFSLDAANAGRLDPRCSFTRSDTPPTYAAPSAVHYWSNEKHLSSENLLLQSSDFDTSWFPNGINGTPTGGQADPAGGANGFTVVEDSAPGAVHRIFQVADASGDLAFTVYAKQNSGTRYLTLTLFNANNNWTAATFDLAGGSPATGSGSSSVFSGVSATQTASGNGYYKCTIKATGALSGYVYIYLGSSTAAPTGTYGSVAYSGDGTSSLDIAFASLTSTGATDYNATTTQIHREYAPTLKSVATAGQPRFEYDPSADGQSVAKGILIEGQSTNLATRSDEFEHWSYARVNRTVNAAVAPSGNLTADLVYADGTASNTHLVQSSFTATAAPYTFSVYVKAAGCNYVRLSFETIGSGYGHFDLANGTVTASNTTSQIESVGNGWWRVSITETLSSGTSYGRISISTSSGTVYWNGDDYSGVLLSAAQIEQNSFASSAISTSGATATRAAESLSVDTADIGYTGGPVSVVGEFALNADAISSSATVVQLTSTGGNDRAYVYRDQGNERLYGVIQSDGAYPVSKDLLGAAAVSGTNYKFAFSADTNDYKAVVNNGTVHTDTDMQLPNEFDKLAIGYNFHGGAGQINGHYKRLAVYANDMTSANVSALTS